MEVKQEGAGYCGRCHSPLLSQIGQREPVCMACQEAAKPKTGRTVVVTGEQGTGLEGVVMGHEVEHNVGADSPLSGDSPSNIKPTSRPTPIAPKPVSHLINLSFSLTDLEQPNILLTIMQALYDGIDNLPPPPTLKETKKAIAIQGVIEAQIKKLKGE